MNNVEAIAKLKYYHTDYGDWVYTTTPEAACLRAKESRQQASLETTDTLLGLSLLSQAVQFDSIANCLKLLEGQVPRPPVQPVSLAERRLKRNAEKDLQSVIGSITTYTADASVCEIDDDNTEYETFTMTELTQKAPVPEFKRGDAVWTIAFDESGLVEGYIPVIIVGLEIYPDEIFYMIGHYDEIDGTITTNYESVEAEDVFKEIPDTLDPYNKDKQRPKLRIVK